ncbi:MAG: hypothetical protein WB586_21635 [Chthoniobacterales bacterium]
MPEESFDFLGYTLGRCYRVGTGEAYIGAKPSQKRVVRLCERISQMTKPQLCWRETEEMVGELNLVLSNVPLPNGWSGAHEPSEAMNNYHESQGGPTRGDLRSDRWVLTRLGTKRGDFEASCPEPFGSAARAYFSSQRPANLRYYLKFCAPMTVQTHQQLASSKSGRRP